MCKNSDVLKNLVHIYKHLEMCTMQKCTSIETHACT